MIPTANHIDAHLNEAFEPNGVSAVVKPLSGSAAGENGKSDRSDIETYTKGKSYHDKFLSCIIDQTKDYPLPVPVVSIFQNGETIPFLTLKSFSLWQESKI